MISNFFEVYWTQGRWYGSTLLELTIKGTGRFLFKSNIVWRVMQRCSGINTQLSNEGTRGNEEWRSSTWEIYHHKVLTKPPESHPDAKNQTHLQVALRLKQSGYSSGCSAGDTIPYIIWCEQVCRHFWALAYHGSKANRVKPLPVILLAHSIALLMMSSLIS